MTSSEFGWTAVSIFLLGVLAGWALFSTPLLWPRMVLNNGTLADWAAAAGAWIIGYGALKYARATLAHTLSTTRRSRETDLKRDISTLSSALEVAILCGFLSSDLTEFSDADEPTRGRRYREVLSSVVARARELNWTDAQKLLLDGKTLGCMAATNNSRRHLLTKAEDALAWLDKVDLKPDAADLHTQRVIMDGFAAVLAKEASDLIPLIVAERDRLAYQLSTLQEAGP